MTELLKVQKIFRRLRILFAVFAVLCVILSLLAAGAAVVWGIKGEEYLSGGGFLSRIAEALDFGGGGVTLGLFIMDAISFFALGVLLIATVICLNKEIKEGTPFSESGAHRTRVLGMLFFFISLATEMAAVILRESFSVAQAESLGVVGGMAAGVALLVTSSMRRYGARLQDMLMLKDVPDPETDEAVDHPRDGNGAEGSDSIFSLIAKEAAEAEKVIPDDTGITQGE